MFSWSTFSIFSIHRSNLLSGFWVFNSLSKSGDRNTAGEGRRTMQEELVRISLKICAIHATVSKQIEASVSPYEFWSLAESQDLWWVRGLRHFFGFFGVTVFADACFDFNAVFALFNLVWWSSSDVFGQVASVSGYVFPFFNQINQTGSHLKIWFIEKFKDFLASRRNTIPCWASVGIVFLGDPPKEQYPKTDISFCLWFLCFVCYLFIR